MSVFVGRRLSGLSVLASVAVVALCGCGGNEGSDEGSVLCEAGVSVDCGDVPASDVNGERFVAGLGLAVCAADGASWDTSACTRIGGGAEFSACVGSGQGDCDSGYTCVATGESSARCLMSCSDDASCGDERICVNWDGVSRYCFNLVGTGEACFANAACTVEIDSCLRTGSSFDASADVDTNYFSCTRSCDGDQVGHVGGGSGSTCSAEETCVASAFDYEIQKNGAAEAECNPSATTDSCMTTLGYTCAVLTNSDGTQKNRCIRLRGFCIGNVLPYASTLSAALEVHDEAEAGSLASVCFVPEGETYQGEVYIGNYACGPTGVVGVPARTVCQRFDDSVYGYCVGFCDGPNDTLLDCGTGYHCDRPEPSDAAYFDGQLDPVGNSVTCSGTSDTTSCDAASGYACVNDNGTFVCATPSRVCLRD